MNADDSRRRTLSGNFPLWARGVLVLLFVVYPPMENTLLISPRVRRPRTNLLVSRPLGRPRTFHALEQQSLTIRVKTVFILLFYRR